MAQQEYDVCVAGAGNAALCAAIAAAENGARVLVLERAPEPENGGNSRFTAGGIRFVYNGCDDLLDICDLSEEEINNSDFGSYSESQFFDDMFRVTEFRFGRSSGKEQPGHRTLATPQRRQVHTDVWPSGFQGRR